MKKLFFLTIALFVAIAANAQFDYTETSIYTLPLNQVFTNMVNCSFNQTAAPGYDQVTGKNEIKLTTGGTEASFNMGPDVKWTWTNSQDGAVIAKQYGNYVQPNGKDRVITITAAAGTKVIINVFDAISADGVTMTGILGDFAGFEAGANEFTATGNIVITTVSEKPKFSAIITQNSVSISDDCSKNGQRQYVGGATPSDGSAAVISTSGRTSCEYVQLWAGGPKWATFNVGATITDYANLSVGADATSYYNYADQAPYYNTANVGGLYAGNQPNYNGRKTTWTSSVTTGVADVATTLWGSNWKTPTRQQLDTLHNSSYGKTTWTWCDGSTTQYVPGCTLKGYKVSGTGDYADKYIFLPAAGYFNYDDGTVRLASGSGYYWSSTENDSSGAYPMAFYSSNRYMYSSNRGYGHSVRAVMASGAWATNYILTLYADGCETPNVYTCSSGQQLYVSAIASIEGNVFAHWQDGNTDNPRLVTLVDNLTLTAFFVNQFIVSATSSNDSYGKVSGSGTYRTDSAAVLLATPKYGYHFTQWSDGNTENPRSFVVTCDTTFQAEFAKNSYEITTSAATAGGTTRGDTIALYEDRVTISAMADYGYYFYAWQDGNSTNPRTITVTENKEYSATFRKQNFTIFVATDNSTMGTVTGGGSSLYQDTRTVSASAQSGYEFSHWNDGNTDNPRSVLVESDSTFTAYFQLKKSGECGTNLTWRYADGTLYISGTGVMNNFTSSTMPWLLLRDSIEAVSIDNGVTSIGNYAFYGCQNRAFRTLSLPQSIVTIGSYAFANCNRLTSINFSNDLEEVGDYAFSGCTRVNDMTIYATITPDAYNHTFDGVNTMAYLYVQPNSVRTYKLDPIWGVFDVQGIGASSSTTTVTDVQVEPTNNEANFTWPTDNAAASYSLEITKDGVVFCTLTFNANGQLTGLAFAPGRDGLQHAPAAELTANGGMTFTVTGLNSATAYAYTFETKNASQQVIRSYTGNFATTGYVEPNPGPATALDNIDNSVTIQKVLRNGQLYIITPEGMFDALGRRVEE